MKVAIVSADTMIYRKQKDDTCSPIVRRVLDQVSFKTELVQPVPNDREVIRKILAKIADAQMADLILRWDRMQRRGLCSGSDKGSGR